MYFYKISQTNGWVEIVKLIIDRVPERKDVRTRWMRDPCDTWVVCRLPQTNGWVDIVKLIIDRVPERKDVGYRWRREPVVASNFIWSGSNEDYGGEMRVVLRWLVWVLGSVFNRASLRVPGTSHGGTRVDNPSFVVDISGPGEARNRPLAAFPVYSVCCFWNARLARLSCRALTFTLELLFRDRIVPVIHYI